MSTQTKSVIKHPFHRVADKALGIENVGVKHLSALIIYKIIEGTRGMPDASFHLNIAFDLNSGLVTFDGTRMEDHHRKNLKIYFEEEAIEGTTTFSRGILFEKPISQDDAKRVIEAWATLTADII